MKWLLSFALLTGAVASSGAEVEVTSFRSIFDEVAQTFEANFYDKTFSQLPLKPMIERYRKQIEHPMDVERFKWIVREFFAEFKVSHLEIHEQDDQEYWAIKSIMSKNIDDVKTEQIEAWFERKDGKWFVSNVFDGGAAEKSGLLVGDEVLKVGSEDFHPVRSFAGKSGQKVELSIRRKLTESPQIISVEVVNRSFARSFEMAIGNSKRLDDRGTRKIGYVHLWAASHPEHQAALSTAIKELAPQADALVLDLRDGFGGGDLSWIDSHFMNVGLDGKKQLRTFSKKLMVLINENTRSGKEWMAAYLKKKRRATLVGQKTAGVFMMATAFNVAKGQFLLVLPTGKGPKDVQIERNGIAPNVKIKWKKPYSAGKDHQLNYCMNDLAIN